MESPISKVDVRSSDISGHGTFATQRIARGEFIRSLTGEPFTYLEAERVSILRGITVDDALQIDDDLMLILDESARLINHSCEPNCGIRNRNDLYALRDIHIGEEITYDYSTTVNPDDTWMMKCRCRKKHCRGTISTFITIPPSVLRWYYNLNALPDFVKRQVKKMAVVKEKV